MVDVLLEITPKELVKTLKLSLLSIQNTDLGLLNSLKRSGMEFSEHAQAVIAKKERKSVGLLLSIGIALITFTDFCKETLFNQEGVSFDTNSNTFFKPAQPEAPTDPAAVRIIKP